METSEQIEKFDPSKLMDGVKDRIKATFVSLIPDDEWQKMIQKEIDNFFTYRQQVNSGYNSSTLLPTEFAQICSEELTTEAKRRIADFLTQPEFQIQWTQNGVPAVSAAVEKVIIENSGAVLANMIGGLSSTLMRDMAQRMQSSY